MFKQKLRGNNKAKNEFRCGMLERSDTLQSTHCEWLIRDLELLLHGSGRTDVGQAPDLCVLLRMRAISEAPACEEAAWRDSFRK